MSALPKLCVVIAMGKRRSTRAGRIRSLRLDPCGAQSGAAPKAMERFPGLV